MPRRILLLFVALLIAATATLLTQRWLGARLSGAAAAATPVTVEVLVAARALDTGSVIAPGALEWAHWPVDAARGLKQRDTTNMASFNGAVVRSALLAGEPVTDARLAQPGTRGPMAAVLAPGARAVTISVTPASGIAGFVVPGDRVDLLLTQTLAGGSGSAERHLSQTVLHDVRVLGTDQHGGGDDAADAALDATAGAAMLGSKADAAAPPTTVTLEVSPRGAELVAVAAELGKLSLSLRSLVAGATDARGPTWDTDATHVLPRAVAAAPQPPAAVPYVVAPPAPPAAQRPASAPASSIVVRGIGATNGQVTP